MRGAVNHDIEVQTAMHCRNALPIITPCYKFWEIPYYWAGLKAYDLVAGTQALFWSSFMSARSAR
jgi:glycerol-3-phosphate dehydrogenase